MPGEPSSSADAVRARQLRRMKVTATGLFVVAAVVFVAARSTTDGEAGQGWLGYVRAGAEAAMVGALADWFAVTALFRHPLRLPIPHTAIIKKRKDDIGRSLGEFVEGNFLTRELITERLDGVGVGRRVGAWLATPAHAERAAAAIGDAAGGVLEVLDDRDVQEAVGSAVERRLAATDVAPLLAKAVDVAVEGGHHQRLLDAAMRGVAGFLTDNRRVLRDRLDRESPWWVPESIDDRVFDKIFTAVQSFLADVTADPRHEVRRSVDERVAALAHRLRDDPALIAKCDEIKRELIAHHEVQAWIHSLWGEVKGSMLAAAGDPQSELRRRLADGIGRAGARLADDAELQAKIDGWIERLVVHVVDNYKSEVADLISSTVERWDADETSRRIELQVGRDLQFIRINGTVVGGLAGIAIHAIGSVL
ncbi:DUF445 domain-containing protein [Desertimonas flava]|jgi:uncharacterized membrane-anchored protein YjiN (DUF445 family)|uniref:DUF445 domain-containing protein n=1 Tax=Desertimonas flava TaxID=2064846 RepID=UPI000E345888|nr:DUF445 domain-containing protein [Desertimonas flava]